MQQQQQLQWSAACQWVLGWMGAVVVVVKGERGFVAVALGGWGSSWSGPPPDTLAPRAGGLLNHHTPPPNPANPGSQLPLPTQIAPFSFCVSTLCLSLFSLLPPWLFFPSSVSSFCWFASRFIYYSTPFFFSLTAVLSVAVLPDSVFSTFSPESCGFLHLRHPFSALSLLNPFTLNVPRKYLVAWLKKSKQGWFGLCVSQNTVKIVSIFKRKEHFNGALDICNGIRL